MATENEFTPFMAKLVKRYIKAVNRDAPRRAGQVAVRFIKENFDKEGFFGQQWPNVKRRTNPPKGKGKKAAANHRILTGDTGNLRRSIQFEVGNAEVTVFSDLPYSAVHNEGLRAGRGKGFQMPRRQFIGDHPKLAEALTKAVQDEITKKLK
ncbi:MAG: phage virion morphogenesis protein [Bacteroidales bacterium]|nr:phage virion morphogenesis protein [Bacteroidales bacterium]